MRRTCLVSLPDEYVPGRQVPVHHLLGGEVEHPPGDLEGEGGEVPGRQRRALPVEVAVVVLGPVAPQVPLQGVAVHVLQDQEDRVWDRGVLKKKKKKKRHVMAAGLPGGTGIPHFPFFFFN